MERYPMQPKSNESLWPKVRGYVLWGVSAILSFVSFMMLHLTLWMVVEAAWPYMEGRTVEMAGGVRTTEIVGLLFLAIGWIGWVIAMEQFYVKAPSTKVLIKRFVKVTVVQVIIAAVYFVTPTILRLFL
jgi:hypothetical protein